MNLKTLLVAALGFVAAGRAVDAADAPYSQRAVVAGVSKHLEKALSDLIEGDTHAPSVADLPVIPGLLQTVEYLTRAGKISKADGAAFRSQVKTLEELAADVALESKHDDGKASAPAVVKAKAATPMVTLNGDDPTATETMLATASATSEIPGADASGNRPSKVAQESMEKPAEENAPGADEETAAEEEATISNPMDRAAAKAGQQAATAVPLYLPSKTQPGVYEPNPKHPAFNPQYGGYYSNVLPNTRFPGMFTANPLAGLGPIPAVANPMLHAMATSPQLVNSLLMHPLANPLATPGLNPLLNFANPNVHPADAAVGALASMVHPLNSPLLNPYHPANSPLLNPYHPANSPLLNPYHPANSPLLNPYHPANSPAFNPYHPANLASLAHPWSMIHHSLQADSGYAAMLDNINAAIKQAKSQERALSR